MSSPDGAPPPLTVSNANTDLLIIVHGIRDTGPWMYTVKNALEHPKLRVVTIPYGYFNVLKFLSPFWFRARVVQYVESRLRHIIADHRLKHPTATISVLAHSFGCYVVSRMLARDRYLRLHKLVFCGSVMPGTFPSDILLLQVDTFVNDCGNKDIWPLIASRITWGYGDTGVFGFGLSANDRFHDCRHGEFFTDVFIDKYWTSFFHGNALVPGDRPGELGWLRRFLLWFPLKWLLLGALILLLWWQRDHVHWFFSWAGFEFGTPVIVRHTYTQKTIPVTAYYAREPGVGLFPPNSEKGVMEEDLVQAMFVWKKWVAEAAKTPRGDPTKALVVIRSDDAFGKSYYAFNATINTNPAWRIVEGCAFLTYDRDDTRYRPVYRQLDLDIPVSRSVLEHNKLELAKPAYNERLFIIVRIESEDGKTIIPQDASNFGISIQTR